MHIILIQTSPAFKSVETNLAKSSQVFESLNKDGSLDKKPVLAILPEMTFTGYCFKDREDILEYCIDVEKLDESLIMRWAVEITKRYGVFIQFGVGRKVDEKLYNSLVLMDPEGKIRTVYDKTFLYYTDETWATEGRGFQMMDIRYSSDRLPIKVGFAICMDFNNYKFESPWDLYEMATYYADRNVQLLQCCMAWLEAPLPVDSEPPSEKEKIYNRLNYWAARLKPIIVKSGSDSSYRCVVLISNRVGQEGEVVFGGTSCCFIIENGRISLESCLGTTEEAVLKIATTV